jgi:hypothetical protein
MTRRRIKITAAQLHDLGACDVDVFEKEWPDGCYITKANCIRAFCELHMGLYWSVEWLLSDEAEREFNKADAVATEEYRVARLKGSFGGVAALQDKYRETTAIAFYEAATKPRERS